MCQLTSSSLRDARHQILSVGVTPVGTKAAQAQVMLTSARCLSSLTGGKRKGRGFGEGRRTWEAERVRKCAAGRKRCHAADERVQPAAHQRITTDVLARTCFGKLRCSNVFLYNVCISCPIAGIPVCMHSGPLVHELGHYKVSVPINIVIIMPLHMGLQMLSLGVWWLI